MNIAEPETRYAKSGDVHIGSRVMNLAAPGEVMVTGTLRDLVAGSPLRFAERGVHELKEVPGKWPLYSASC